MSGGPQGHLVAPRPAPVGLYLHVPFCASLCSYCDFYRTAAPSGVPEGFEDRLLQEGRLYAESPPVAVDTVYFGGGTPSLLHPQRLARLLGGLRDIFSLEADAEVTLEANPETVEEEGLRLWRAAGVNRLSLGAQSLDAGELALLERRASAQRVRDAVRAAADAGYTRLAVDVMVGVPGQTPASLARTLDEVVTWPVDHVSAYLLDLHRGTALFDRVAHGECSLPDEEASAGLYETLCTHLEASGFRQYEVSNFARPGGQSRHNLKYWRGQDTLGLGPSAHGCFRGLRTENPRSTARWEEALAAGRPPHERTAPVSVEERLENRLLFGLRLTEGVEEEVVREFLEGQGRDASATLAPLLAHGYAERDGGDRLRLTRRGFLVSNEVLGYLLPSGWRAQRGVTE